jgi:hypothetical protein
MSEPWPTTALERTANELGASRSGNRRHGMRAIQRRQPARLEGGDNQPQQAGLNAQPHCVSAV